MDVVKPLSLRFDGEEVESKLTRLINPEDAVAIANAWGTEWLSHKDSCPRRAQWPIGWGWSDIFGKLGGRVYELSADGVGGRLGMVAVERGEFMKEGETLVEALALEYVAKGPRAFGVGVGGVAHCLVLHAIELSKEVGLGGRVVIPAALARDAEKLHDVNDCPARLYSRMGFIVVEGDPDGVESVRMEISAKDAEEFIRRVRNGN